MIVYVLTIDQKDSLIGIEYVKDNMFNPIEDINGNWIISYEEVSQCSIDWVKKLNKIEYNPVINEINIDNG